MFPHYFDKFALMNKYEEEKRLLIGLAGSGLNFNYFFEQLRPPVMHGENSILYEAERNKESLFTSITTSYNITSPDTLPLKRVFSIINNAMKPKESEKEKP